MSEVPVDVWILPLTGVTPERLLTLRSLLSDDERGRAARFALESDATAYVLSHALLRTVLSRYAAVPPAAWSFVANPHGRPEIAASGPARLRFNLSHTAGCAVVAVARDRDVGVDVEALSRRPVSPGIAARYFAPSEQAAVRDAAPTVRDRVVLEIWTLKEAYIKARGIGLSLGLQQFTCCRGYSRVATLTCEPAIDDGERWHLEQFAPSPLHVGAVAVARTPAERIAVRLQRVGVADL